MIVAIISIAASVILGIFLFNQDSDFIKIRPDDSKQENFEEITSTPTQNFAKNTAISIFCGGSIYIMFYAIPHEYKKTNQEKKDE